MSVQGAVNNIVSSIATGVRGVKRALEPSRIEALQGQLAQSEAGQAQLQKELAYTQKLSEAKSKKATQAVKEAKKEGEAKLTQAQSEAEKKLKEQSKGFKKQLKNQAKGYSDIDKAFLRDVKKATKGNIEAQRRINLASARRTRAANRLQEAMKKGGNGNGKA